MAKENVLKNIFIVKKCCENLNLYIGNCFKKSLNVFFENVTKKLVFHTFKY